MVEWYNLKDKIKRYYGFDKDELKVVIISILIMAFIVGYDDGSQTVNITHWLWNFVSSILLVTLAFLVHVSAQKIVGLAVGFKARFKFWIYGMVFALIVTFISRGKVWLLIPGGIVCSLMHKHRLGKFRYGFNYWTNGMVAFVGPLSNILLALVLKTVFFFAPANVLLQKAIAINVVYAVTSNLPIPPMDGINLFFSSRLTYVFTYGAIIGAAVVIFADINLFFTLFFSLLIGGVIWLVYLLSYELKAW